jgi:uncharacterized protein (TIGR03085 family)
MPTPATQERHRFADALAEVGPDAPTLCEGWTARDLAAHIVLRDSRPDAAAGLVVSALSGHTDKVQAQVALQPWDELVEQVRSGPPRWSPFRIDKVDRVVNTVEFFVHHEDVRRAQPAWEPRELDPPLTGDLTASLRRGAKLLARRAPSGLTLAPADDGEPIVAKTGEPMVTLTGPPGEIVLFLYGRQSVARVDLTGPDDAVAATRAASYGL